MADAMRIAAKAENERKEKQRLAEMTNETVELQADVVKRTAEFQEKQHAGELAQKSGRKPSLPERVRYTNGTASFVFIDLPCYNDVSRDLSEEWRSVLAKTLRHENANTTSLTGTLFGNFWAEDFIVARFMMIHLSLKPLWKQ